jgi:Flp pilus assembly protein TadG
MACPKIHRLLAELRDDRRGVSIIEMTVMLPVLVSLAFGVAEFGRALQHHHVMNKAMRDAARYLTRVPVDCPSGAATGSVTNGADITTAKNLALNAAPTGGTPRLSYWTNPASVTVQVDCFDNTAGTYRGQSGMPLITVAASVPYQDVGFLAVLGLPAMTFNPSHQQLHIGE